MYTAIQANLANTRDIRIYLKICPQYSVVGLDHITHNYKFQTTFYKTNHKRNSES
ncbi:hypothetical protein SLEP1_g58349 [Rubroshorea leprosula]|uniref:Uncharacterized protein n=1 Tax=Rubroshorea leprosula TaxID=152421 RepID=A0AAV5MQ87_9ROSI|nr:hypothetical protein SLEP1_g58349 [Rubroshorea leprosula]